MTNERSIDGFVTAWLRAEATTGGASGRVLARTLDQVAGLGQERPFIRGWRLPERQVRRLALLAAVMATLLAAAGVAVYTGSRQAQETQPAPLPERPAATTPPIPAGLSALVEDQGAADAPIGRVTWTKLSGDDTNLPGDGIVATPDGFASLESGIARTASRLMVSADGLSWSEAPLPVMVTTGLSLGRFGDEFWIAAEDFRLWRSTDFRTWTEVNVGDLAPPAVPGFDRRSYFGTPITVGTTTLLPLRVSGMLALDELLDVSLEPDEVLNLSGGYKDQVLGDVRDVIRTRQTGPGLYVDEEVVGSVRVSASGSMVTVLGASGAVALASIDTSGVGDATFIAKGLNQNEPFGYPIGTMVITDGGLQPTGLPLDASVAALKDAFIAITDDNTIWTSVDGLDWESLGAPDLPAPVDVLGSDLIPAGSHIGDPGGGLAAVITTESDGVQLFEYWTSDDGLRWDRIGVLPVGFSQVIPAGPGRYLSVANTLVTSTTTAEWTVVDGLDGFERFFDDQGGMALRSVAGDTVFVVQVGQTGQRVLWRLALGPHPNP